MKRFFSILLLAILLFNWFGYRLIISFIEVKADARLETLLDENNYDESQLVSIKIPVTFLSYYTNSSFFERVDGQIEIGGVEYKYVKRKLYNDSLELICIPDQTAMRLRAAKNEFFKTVNDLQHKENKKNCSGALKNILTDYLTANQRFELDCLRSATFKWPSCCTAGLPSYFSSVIENPPEISSLL